jgi:hypothetical protein
VAAPVVDRELLTAVTNTNDRLDALLAAQERTNELLGQLLGTLQKGQDQPAP